MKRKIILVLTFLFVFCLCSCNDTRFDNKENIIWKSDLFDIVITSKQFQENTIHNNDNNYSMLYINGNEYSCKFYVSYQSSYMNIVLYDKNTNLEFLFYGEKKENQIKEFLCGHYSKIIKEKNKAYVYFCEFRIDEYGQYYDYCMDYGIEFPKVITLYGYEDK